MGFSTNRPHRITKTVCIFFPKKKPNCSHSVKLLPLTAFVVEAIATPNPSGTISQALIIRNRAALSKFKSHEYQVPNFGPTNFLWGQGHNPPPENSNAAAKLGGNSTSGHAARQKIPPLVVFWRRCYLPLVPIMHLMGYLVFLRSFSEILGALWQDDIGFWILRKVVF